MKCIVIVVILALSACSNAEGRGTGATLPANQLINPISAPSANFFAGDDVKENLQTPSKPQVTPASKLGPRHVNFSDMNFRITLPGPAWKINVTPEGAVFHREQSGGMVFVSFSEDKKSFKEFAEGEREKISKKPTFTVTPIVLLKNPDRATFSATVQVDEISEFAMHGIFRNNPGNAKQLMMLIGFHQFRHSDAHAQIHAIMNSVAPIP